MGLFGRSNKPPRWARPLGSKERFERFVEVVVETLGGRGVEAWQARSGSILLDEVEVALDEAVERCAEVDVDQWSAVLLDIAGEAESDVAHNQKPRGDDVDVIEGDFDDIAPLLRIQLYSPMSKEAVEDPDVIATITRDLGSELTAALVFDFDDGVEQLVDAEVARGWGRDDDELWKIALENLAADPVVGQSLETPGGDILVLSGDGAYVSALALRWRDGFDVEAPHGALIALPSWHALLIHIVDPAATGAVIEPMTALVSQMVADLEDPVSSSIYWEPAAGERFQRVEVDGDLAITGPDALVELLG